MTGIPGLLGQSPAMVEVARLVRAAAAADVTVLLEGETGTGKEVVARAIAELGGR
jgi:two-component system C4-dicarboxylate transport response regulator DctD